VTVLKEGYGPDDLRRDAVAGLTTGIVAGCLVAAILALLKRSVPEEGE
jgi:hypothetical protein